MTDKKPAIERILREYVGEIVHEEDLEKGRNNKGYWKDERVAIKEAKKLIKRYKLKSLPNGDKLAELGYGGLESAILRYHGGFRRFRELLGEEQKKKEDGLWNNEEYILNYIERLKEKNRIESLPTLRQLSDMGESSLGAAIHKYHGGFVKFRQKLGEKLLQKRGMWTSKHTKQQALNFMMEHNLNHLPSQYYLAQRGRSDLATAIAVQGGFRRFRKLLGEKPLIREAGRLKDRKYIEKEIKKLMLKHHLKKVPTTSQLDKWGESSLGHSIIYYHGGYTAFRRSLGEKDVREASGQWKDIDFGTEEARRIMKKHDLRYLPGSMELRKMGYSSLAGSITKYYGGYHKFREYLGENRRKIENGKLAQRDYVLTELKRIIKEKKCKSMPTTTQLREWGYSSLAQSLFKYHGGMNSITESLGKKQRRFSNGSWEDLEFALIQTKKILGENKLIKLPSHEKLIKYNLGPSLSRAIIKYHGGYNSFREVLNEYLRIPSDDKQLTSLLERYVGGTQ